MNYVLFMQTLGRYPSETQDRWHWSRNEAGEVIVTFLYGLETVNF